MIRTAYGIESDPLDDIVYGLCCPCCVTNQLYQTTKRLGNTSRFGGREYNRDVFQASLMKDICYNCCLATFCMPCAIGSTLESAIGMPFCIGCFCVNPFLARNIMRYHYRIAGDENLETIVPITCYTIDRVVQYSDPNNTVILFFIGALLVTMQLLAEVAHRGNENIVSRRYLSGYDAINSDDHNEDDGDQNPGEFIDATGRRIEAVPIIEQSVEMSSRSQSNLVRPIVVLN